MVGVTSYGVYIPLFRLGKETGGWLLPLERSIANFDEDSLTMAVAATTNCMGGMNRAEVDALYFATTTPPYLEKQSATIAAIAADLRKDIFTIDITDTLRAGTSALKLAVDAIKSGSIKQALVTATDCRLAEPRSVFEQNGGDGAAALLIGEDNVVASIEGSFSVSHEILDVWRIEGERTIRSWEDRFCTERGYVEAIQEGVSGLLAKYKMSLKDFAKVVYPAPDVRQHRAIAKLIQLAPEQIQEPFWGALGATGTAFPLMLLAAALDNSKSGDRILLLGQGDGCDAIILQVTNQIDKMKTRGSFKQYLAAKKILPGYETYLAWRGFHNPDTGVRQPPLASPSAPALLREQDRNLRFYGVKCHSCGAVQYPPQRVCAKCGQRDNFDKVRLSDKKATLFTYSMDYIAGIADPPEVVAVINFESGGRALVAMTDRDIKDVKVGMPLEMSFRSLYTAAGIHNYYWKCIPTRV